MSSRFGIRVGLAALLALGAASSAIAGGGIFTVQQLSFSLKSDDQGETKTGDGKTDKRTESSKDVFESCVGSPTPPTKTQGIYLFIDCTALNSPTDPVLGSILAIDTQANPPTLVALVGTLAIHTDLGILTTKSSTPTSAIVPVEITVDCNSSATTATLVGVMTMKLSALGNISCPDSGSIKLLGTGSSVDPMSMNPIDFIIDNGSSITIKKRSATITSLPLP